MFPQEHVRLVPSAFVLPAIPAAGAGASAGLTAAATALAVINVPIVVAAVLLGVSEDHPRQQFKQGCLDKKCNHRKLFQIV